MRLQRSWLEPAGALAGVVLALAALICCPSVQADFTKATLLSGTRTLEFEEANAPALSADGRYAAFQGTLAGRSGIYRRNLISGEVELVAEGDAAAPSVNADGRYVAFTTTADLQPAAGRGTPGEPEADRGCPEVYIRDMETQSGAPGAYTLASELNGTEEGIAFAGGCPPPHSSGAFPLAGAQAAAGVALSADGKQVAFTVLSESNLAGPATAPSQIAVRDLETSTTTLVTATANGQAVVGGGAVPSAESRERGANEYVGVGGFPSHIGDQAAASSAAISADGSTVAWLGTDVAAQVSQPEVERAPSLPATPLPLEVEPLWRRIAGEGVGHTRRLLAGAGLDFFYPRLQEPTDPVVSGSFVGTQRVPFIPPVLSADGGTVGLIATAPPPSVEPSLNERANIGLSELSSDAYAVRVSANPATAPQVTTLTEIPSYGLPSAVTEGVKDLAVSADGTRMAFDTARTQLYLPSLALISSQAAYTDIASTYEANLQLGTLERVTATYDGTEPNGETGLLSFSGDGQTLVFASQATNLFYGDFTQAWEVYSVQALSAPAAVASELLGTSPPPLVVAPEWALSATASTRGDGIVVVDAEVPGAGRLAVDAIAQLPLRTTRARRGRPRGRPALASRSVSSGGVTVGAAAELQLRLRARPAYSARVGNRDGLYALLRISFSARGRRTLTREIPVTFHRVAGKSRSLRRLMTADPSRRLGDRIKHRPPA